MTYRDGQKIALGDLIEHAGSPGIVIGFPDQTGSPQVSPGFEWTTDAGKGLWVRFSNGAVVHLDDVDEDLNFVARGGTLR